LHNTYVEVITTQSHIHIPDCISFYSVWVLSPTMPLLYRNVPVLFTFFRLAPLHLLLLLSLHLASPLLPVPLNFPLHCCTVSLSSPFHALTIFTSLTFRSNHTPSCILLCLTFSLFGLIYPLYLLSTRHFILLYPFVPLPRSYFPPYSAFFSL
jgi:hypothetical protein